MITHRFELSKAEAALDMLDKGHESALKIVIEAH
jgi:hypothetical protein